jgi:hypothetical protein
MTTHVYICHKCGGTLSHHDDAALYGCGCMSGYVRDWQLPVSMGEARSTQVRRCIERVALYRMQGRAESGMHIQDTLADMARLIGSMER